MQELYDFILNLINSAGFASIAGFFIANRLKIAELNASEKHRKQKLLDEERIKTYKKFFSIQLRLPILEVAKELKKENKELTTAHFSTLLELNTLLPEMQIIAEDKLYNEINTLSALINNQDFNNINIESEEEFKKRLMNRIVEISEAAGRVQIAIRNEILNKDESYSFKENIDILKRMGTPPIAT